MEVKSNRENFTVNLSAGTGKGKKRKRDSYYTNLIDKDPKKVAQVLLDLFMYGVPIDKAIKIFIERIKKRDWLGL